MKFILYSFISIFLVGYLQTEGRHKRILCGPQLQLYNPVKEVCFSGQVFCIATRSSAGIYERSSPNKECVHPASNDEFFRNPRKKLRTNNRICQESRYVYRIDIKRQKNGHYLTANVGMWAWSPTSNRVTMRMRKSPTHRKEMEIKLDKYSPSVKKHKSFLIFSKYNYLKDSVFVLRPNEVLYESPKDNKRTVRVLKNIHENCLVDLVRKLSSPGDAAETNYVAIKRSRSSRIRVVRSLKKLKLPVY